MVTGSRLTALVGDRVTRRSLRDAAQSYDTKVLHRWSRRRSGSADRLLIAVTHAANRSMLWFGMAAALALFGGPRGRRASAEGVLAIAIASFTANVPLKFAVRRVRPAPEGSRIRVPRSSSFPSGHSASAFAFATAVTRREPAAGVLLVPLAGAVAYSRAYTGVHYPSDVLLGAAVGVGCGLLADDAASRLMAAWSARDAQI